MKCFSASNFGFVAAVLSHTLMLSQTAVAQFHPFPIPIPTIVPNTIVVPSGIAATLSDALAKVPDGGTIKIRAGVHAGAKVTDKNVTIVGLGPTRSDVIVGGIILEGNSSVTLEKISLDSSTGSIQAIQSASGAPSLNLKNAILKTKGINGVFQNLALDQVQANFLQSAGVVAEVQGKFSARIVDILQPSGPGMVIKSTKACTMELALVGVTLAKGIGIQLKGPLCAATATGLRIQNAQEAGLDLREVKEVSVNHSDISGTFAGTDGKYGDGVRVVFSSVTLLNSNINRNVRAGVSVFGCGGFAPAIARIGDTNLYDNIFDMDIEMMEHPFMVFLRSQGQNVQCSGKGQLEDLDGNECGSPDSPKPCKAQSSSIDPIPLPVFSPR